VFSLWKHHHPYRVDDSAVSKALFDYSNSKSNKLLHSSKLNLMHGKPSNMHYSVYAELEQVQKYLAQLQTKQSSLQQELEQAFNLNQLHIELNQAPEQILQTLNELRQATQTAISSFDSENLRLTQAIKQHNQLVQTIQRNESLLNTAQQWQQQVQHIVECLSKPNSTHGSKQVAKQLSRLGLFLMHVLSNLNNKNSFHSVLNNSNKNLKC
jgi:exonuclease SbcC